jgi:glutamate synthase (NADPH/NADH) large chain
VLDWKLLDTARPALEHGTPVTAAFPIRNTDRTTGTLLSNEITRSHPGGLPDGTIRFRFDGTAGQSFGAFLAKGLTLHLEGDANDYFGKGLSGGQLIVHPHPHAAFKAEENIVIGNVALYGATSGAAYIRGMAGERFCVRNSGATAVVEGVGDHGCEYMTGGTALILGPTGRNFAAGMSGGIAYVYDTGARLATHVNPEMVDLDPLDDDDRHTIRQLLDTHARLTDSPIARFVLDDFDQQANAFVKVFPKDYKKVLAKRSPAIRI